MRMFYRVPVHAVDYLLWLDSSGLRPQETVSTSTDAGEMLSDVFMSFLGFARNNDARPGCALQYVQHQYIPGSDSHSPASG
jgi:hypothetical protein